MVLQTMRSNSTSLKDNFDNKRLSLPHPASHISSIKSSQTPHVPKRDLYQTSKIEEYYTMFKKKDEKSKVLKYLLFNGNLRTLREHELKYGDCVVNRPRFEKDEWVNFYSIFHSYFCLSNNMYCLIFIYIKHVL